MKEMDLRSLVSELIDQQHLICVVLLIELFGGDFIKVFDGQTEHHHHL